MKKVIVWGTGNYYRSKEAYIKQNYEIIAYVSKEEGKKNIDGIDIISPDRILTTEYNEILIMSHKNLFEIRDMIRKLHLPYEKIILGENILPHTIEENLYMFSGSSLYLDREGEIIYEYMRQKQKITEASEWDKVKELFVDSQIDFTQLPVLPLHRQFQYGGGKGISRYYIEKFLEKNRKYITGKVLEVGDNRYTTQFGSNLTESWVIDFVNKQKYGYCKVNLETGEGVKENFADCIILTSVLGTIFDVQKAAENIVKMLKVNGVALITTNGTAPISKYDEERWGYYWKFTNTSMRRLFERYIGDGCIDVEIYGNVKTCAAYLYGIPAEELTEEALNYKDSDYQLVLGTIVRK